MRPVHNANAISRYNILTNGKIQDFESSDELRCGGQYNNRVLDGWYQPTDMFGKHAHSIRSFIRCSVDNSGDTHTHPRPREHRWSGVPQYLLGCRRFILVLVFLGFDLADIHACLMRMMSRHKRLLGCPQNSVCPTPAPTPAPFVYDNHHHCATQAKK